MRLDKYLADAGKGTRSEVKRLIAKGRVSVNDIPVKDPAYRVSEDTAVCIDGRPVRYAAFEYYMLNKPIGVISATKEEAGSAVCVTDLITDKIRKDLFPVGRLDKDTEGLLLITNDGDVSHRLLSPKHHVDKTYEVLLDRPLRDEVIRCLEAGVDIGDGKPTLPCRIERLAGAQCRITIHEGRYHQIKRMFQSQGLEVRALKRISMGPLVLDPALAPGEYRPLTQEEIALLP